MALKPYIVKDYNFAVHGEVMAETDEAALALAKELCPRCVAPMIERKWEEPPTRRYWPYTGTYS